MLRSSADPMDEEPDVRPLELPAGPTPWVRWWKPLLLGSLAIFVAALVAPLVQVPIAKATGVSLAWSGDVPLSPQAFLILALGTDTGLFAASVMILLLVPGTIRFGLRRGDLLRAGATFAALFSVNLAASWGMQRTEEPYLGLPEIPHGLLGVFLVFSATAVAPTLEELFFREALLCRVFAPSSRVFALAVTSVTFGALHVFAGGMFLFLALTSMGVLLGLLRMKTGSLGPSILVHALNNLLAILLTLAAGK